MAISSPLPKTLTLTLLSIFLPLFLCLTSIHATYVPGHIVFPSAACSSLAGVPIWSPYQAASPFYSTNIWNPYHALSPFYSTRRFSPSIFAHGMAFSGISPYATGFYAPAFASQTVNAPFFNQLQANQLFNQLQANQLFNQQQANQLFNQQQANQAFTQMEANQLFNQLQSNQLLNQQQANQLFMNEQLANYLLYPRGGCCPGAYNVSPWSRSIFV